MGRGVHCVPPDKWLVFLFWVVHRGSETAIIFSTPMVAGPPCPMDPLSVGGSVWADEFSSAQSSHLSHFIVEISNRGVGGLYI